MDGDERRRTQHGLPAYNTSSPTTAAAAQQMSYQPSEHFNQSLHAVTRGESSRSSLSRPHTLPSYSSYGYAEQQPFHTQNIQGGSLQYQTGFAQDVSRQSQIPPQQFPQYAGPLLYNLGQAGPSQLSYDRTPQYQDQQSAAVEVLSNQFNVQPPYFVSSAPTSAGIPAAHTHYDYPHQSPSSRPNMQQYDSEMDYSPAGPSHHPAQQQMLPTNDGVEEGYNRYQQQLTMVWRAFHAGRYLDASEYLMDASRWLFSNAIRLG